MDVADFDFELPPERIALRPARPRDSARLLVVEGSNIADRQMLDLPSLLRPVDVLVLRRNARLRPETVAAVFGPQVQVVFDSSCKIWYVARQDSSLRAHGFRTWDVTAQGAFRCRPPQALQ